MKLRYCSVIIASIVLLFFNAGALSADSNASSTFLELTLGVPRIKADGEWKPVRAAPYLHQGEAVIPLHDIAPYMGYIMGKDQAGRTRVSKTGCTVTLDAGSKNVDQEKNGSLQKAAMSIEPFEQDGQLWVPLRSIAEFLDWQVFWTADQPDKIIISTLSPDAERIGADSMIKYLNETGRIENPVTVAVIDNGVNMEHPFLKDRMISPYDAASGSSRMEDYNGHGTQVAGVIANSTPAAVKIMPIRVVDPNGNYTAENLVRAIQYAVEHGATVINLSLSSSSSDHEKQVVLNGIDEAVRQGCTVVAAAGNNGRDVENYLPACSQSAVVVTAVDASGNCWAQSNTGKTVDVSAPGVHVVTAELNGGFGPHDGTSLAAPFVSAACAMLQMDNPSVTPAEIENILIRYANDPNKPGRDASYGAGIINLSQYVQNQRLGIAEDFKKSEKEKRALLDVEISKILEQDLHEKNMLLGSFYAGKLVDEANRACELGNYFAAGYYLENSIRLGNTTQALAKNNLAFLIRRGLYVSRQYDLKMLLNDAKAKGMGEAYLNEALWEASKGNWQRADDIIAEYVRTFDSADTSYSFWRRNTNEGESALLFCWLMRHHRKVGIKTQQEYFTEAYKAYPSMPEWLSQSV